MSVKVHDGHRDRMRKRIVDGGIDCLQSHEILEYILFAFVPRKDTNVIAHALIAEFGSLSAVFNADAERLEKVEGVSPNAALFLSTLPDLFRKYASESVTAKESLKGRGRAREYLAKKFYGSSIERAYVVGLDAQDNLIRCQQLSTGTGDKVTMCVREVVDFAFKSKATSIIIAHNHPSGNTNPSQQDYVITREIACTLESIDVTLADHYIFAGDRYYSFEEADAIKQINEEKKSFLKDGILYYE
ncbi:MAG: DNA repair protein RadC [Clostridia bacterium]